MSSPTVQDTDSVAGKYLTVCIGDEVYGIPVLKVLEIIRLQKITPVPQVPSFVKGVINLRGRVIPIIDLRLRFEMSGETTDRTCIVVVQVSADGRPVQLGTIVDSVEEVANLTREMIEPTPDFGTAIDTAYMLGMAKSNGRVLMLLDLERVVALDALTAAR